MFSSPFTFFSGFDPDAQAFFDAIGASGGTLTTSEKNATNELVLNLKGYGLWTKMIGLYPVVGTTAITQQFNLKDPTEYNLGFFGSSSFSSTGYDPGGNGYALTGIIPTVINFQSLGSIHMSMYITENYAQGGYDFGSFAGGQQLAAISSYGGNNTAYIDVSFNDYLTVANGGTTKKNWLWTNNGTTSFIYRDGSEIANGAKSLGVGPSIQIALSGTNENGIVGQLSQRAWALASIGLGFNATEAANYNTAVTTFQTTLGRQN